MTIRRKVIPLWHESGDGCDHDTRKFVPGFGWQSIRQSRGQILYKKVLLAYDGSIEGRRALREGAKLAQFCGAEVFLLGACLNSRCSILGESDSTLGYEQVFSPLEYRSDAASAAECAGLRAERPCVAVYR